MEQRIRAGGRWVADLAGAAFVGAVANRLNLDSNLAAAFAGAALICALIVSERATRGWAISCLFLALAILALGIFLQKPLSPANLKMYFIPDKVEGERLYGRVVVGNESPSKLNILESRISVGEIYFDSSSEPSRQVEPGLTTEFAISQANDLVLKGGDVSLTFTYSYGNGEPVKKPVTVVFRIPNNPTVGKPISPTKCCEGSPEDLHSTSAEKLAWQFDQDVSFLMLSPFPETLPDGTPTRFQLFRPKRRFDADMTRRRVTFASLQNGAWREFSLPLREMPNGTHFIRAGWSERGGHAYLIADNAALAFDAATGKTTRVSVQEALKHDK